MRGHDGAMTSYGIQIERLARFSADERGAVTVDWVVVTAAVVGLAIALAGTIGSESQDHADRIGTAMSTRGIATY